MRVRDRHFLLAEIGMTASCIAVAVLCGFLVFRERKEVASALADFDERASVCERTCADAVGVARSIADEAARFSGVATNADGSPCPPGSARIRADSLPRCAIHLRRLSQPGWLYRPPLCCALSAPWGRGAKSPR